jgi:hypothetical protein
MSYLDKNMQEIEATKGYLYKKLNEHKTDHTKAIDDIWTTETMDMDTTLQLRIQSNNYRLNSIYSPTHEAKRWAEQFQIKNIGIVISMFGMGNGVFVRELLNKLDGRGCILIYEPSFQIFNYVMEKYDISDILNNPNVSITVKGINDNEMKNLLSNHVDWVNLSSQIFCTHPQYDIIFEESLKRFYKIIQDNNNRAVVNKNTDMFICKTVVNNILSNLHLLKKCNEVTELIGRFPGEVPAIVVAAGPSLDKNIEDLKLAKGKAVIFAVDTAVKYLLAHDIEPDFIVTLDPNKSLSHLEDSRCKDIPIFCRIDSRPENISNCKTYTILYNVEGYAKSIFDRLGICTGEIRSGGSVATGAFSLCETIGFKNIILIGQDLAYSGECTHAGGITIDASNAKSAMEIVEDIYGNPIRTRYDWYVYIKWFEDAVEMFEGEMVIDATEGGAKINGTVIMTLREAISKHCTKEIDCKAVLDGMVPVINQEQRLRLKSILDEDMQDFSEIVPMLKEALKLCDRMIDKYNRSINETKSSIRINKRLSDINGELNDKQIYSLLDWDISSDTSEQMADIYQYTDDERKNKLATFQHAKNIYNAIICSADRIKPMLEESFCNLMGEEI